MNIAANTTTVNTSAWELAATAPELTANRTDEQIADWRRLTERLKQLSEEKGWSKAEAARRIGMADGTFSQWFSGKYGGRLDTTNAQVAKFINQQDEQASFFASIPQSPPYFPTKTSREVMEALAWAHVASDLVTITLGAGMGKSQSCKEYKARRPNVWMTTVSEYTKTVNAMLVEIVATLGIHEHNPARLVRAIGERLKASGNALLIIDEAQHLIPEAINQLRHFSDLYECGIALVGNNEIYDRVRDNKEKKRTYAQLRRRVGMRLDRLTPYPEDIAASIAAWGVKDDACVKLLTGIGKKPGALGQIDKTMKAATMLALATGEPVGFKHITAAWKNRNVEDFA